MSGTSLQQNYKIRLEITSQQDKKKPEEISKSNKRKRAIHLSQTDQKKVKPKQEQHAYGPSSGPQWVLPVNVKHLLIPFGQYRNKCKLACN